MREKSGREDLTGLCFLGITCLGIAALTFLEGIINMWHQHGVEGLRQAGTGQFLWNLVCIQLVYLCVYLLRIQMARDCPRLPASAHDPNAPVFSRQCYDASRVRCVARKAEVQKTESACARVFPLQITPQAEHHVASFRQLPSVPPSRSPRPHIVCRWWPRPDAALVRLRGAGVCCSLWGINCGDRSCRFTRPISSGH